MKKCQECSASNANVSFYCYSCGAKLPTETVEDRKEALGLKTSHSDYDEYQADFEEWKAKRLKDFHEEEDIRIKKELDAAFGVQERRSGGFYRASVKEDDQEKEENRQERSSGDTVTKKGFYRKPLPKKKQPVKEARQALVLAILSFFCIGFILAPIALYKASQALKIIEQNPHLEGKKQAQLAIWISAFILCAYIAGFIIMVVASTN